MPGTAAPSLSLALDLEMAVSMEHPSALQTYTLDWMPLAAPVPNDNHNNSTHIMHVDMRAGLADLLLLLLLLVHLEVHLGPANADLNNHNRRTT